MKLTVAQLPQHFSKTLGKFYLVSGEEAFFAQETLSILRQKAAAAGFSDRLRLDIETDADLEACHSHAYTPPLFGHKRLLELHWKGKLSKKGQQFLQAYACQPSPHGLLVVRLGKLDSRTEQTQWFKAVEKAAIVITLWPLPQKQFPDWIRRRARAENLELTPDAVEWLAQAAQGNLQAAAQEIEKLGLLGLAQVDRAVLALQVVDQGCFSAFDWVDAAFAGDAAQTLRILHYLQKEGSEPLLILGALTYELRTAAKLAAALQTGGNLPALFAQYRIRFNKQDGFRAFFSRGGEKRLFDLFLKAGEIDRIVKGACSGEVWQALEALGLAVAGVMTKQQKTIYN